MINQNLIEIVVSLVSAEMQLKENQITTEIQDDFNFLLVIVELSENMEIGSDGLKNIAKKIDQIIPKRNGEYSWMLSIRKGKIIVESYFGGDLTCPEAGI